MKTAVVLLLLLSSFLIAGQTRVKFYYSPDRQLAVRIVTVQDNGGMNLESSIEVGNARGRILNRKNFISKDRQHGYGVLKATWTPDGNFFVFSTIASGGNDPGHFPTYVYIRQTNAIHSLDSLVGVWVTDPEFYVEFPDVVMVTGREMSEDGKLGEAVSRAVQLMNLQK